MKKSGLLFAFIFLLQPLFAQRYKDMMMDPKVNFYDVVAEAHQYFSTIDITQKGTGYKDFLRWQNRNESRYYPTGERNLVSNLFAQEQYEAFLKNNPRKKTRSLFGQWQELGPRTIGAITGHYAAGLGRVEDFFVDAGNTNKIYLGSRSGGFWRTVNGGLTWQNTTDTLFACGVNTITASLTNSDSVLINCRNSENGTSHGIYRSTNGGLSWQQTNFNPSTTGFGGLGSDFKIFKIHYHPLNPSVIIIGTSEGIFRSTDNLQTWTQTQNGADITFIAFHPTNPNIVYAYDNTSGGANENKVLVSINGGISFTPSSLVPGNNLATLFLSTTDACPNCLYAASNNGLWKSLDSGKNYTLITTPSNSVRALAVHTTDSSKIVMGYVDLFNSTNGGQTLSQCTWWSLGSSQHNGTNNQNSYNVSQVYIHADANIMKCINGVYYVGSDGFIAKSADNGVTWQRVSEGTGIRENYCLGTSQSNHYVTMCGSQDNGESIKNKNGWIEFYGADGMEGFVHPLNENWITGSVQYGSRRRTRDGGFTQDGISPPATDGAWISPFAYDPLNPMRIYDFTDSINVSNDFGSTWQYLGKPSSSTILSAAIAENNSQIMVVSTASNIFKSTNGGATFTSIKNGLPNYQITDIAFDPKNDDVIAITYNRYQNDSQKVYITTNGGTTWTNITGNLGNMPLWSVVIDHTPQRNIYVGAEIGIYTKPMNGTTWTLYNDKLPNVSVNELEICYGSNTLKAATWGRGLWEYSLVGRKDYPAIVHTKITTPPTESFPRVSVDQFVTSKISYAGTLSQVWVQWGLDTTLLSNIIPMTNISDSTWVSNTSIPSTTANSKIYFKVFAKGNVNDTSETYRFMYTIQPAEYCQAAGTVDGGNLYIKQVRIANINQVSGNDSITYYDIPLLDLYPNTTYSLTVNANTGWAENDFGVWIDFNGDRYFDTATEKVLYQPNNGDSAVATFMLPTNFAGWDTFRMRVRLSYWGNDPQPCGITLGEVEDYAVQMHFATANGNVEEKPLLIYPNPANEKLYISQIDLNKNEIEIFNAIGQQVMKQITYQHQNANESVLNISALAPGMYYVKVENKVAKFVKE